MTTRYRNLTTGEIERLERQGNYAEDWGAVRVSELIGSKNPTDIQRAIKRTDSARRNYYQQFTGKHWGDAKNFSLSMDSGLLGYETCVKLICEAARGLHSPNE